MEVFLINILITGEYTDRPERGLYKNLYEAGHKISILCNPEDALHKADQKQIRTFPLRIMSRLDLNAIRILKERIQEIKPDIIYATSKRTLTHSLLATIRSTTPIVAYRGVMGNLNLRNPEAYICYNNKRVKKIICVCNAVRDYLFLQGFSEDKAKTVYKGHDASWYSGLASMEIFQTMGVPDNTFVLCCIAQMRPRKGIHILLEAMRYLPGDAVHLLLIENIRDSKIKRDIKKFNLNNNVHCLGYRDDAVVIAGSSDLCVMPSLKREGLPKAVIESMIQGVPAVVTNVGGLPELVEHNKSGLVVPPGDAQSLAKSIAFFMDSPKRCKHFGDQAKIRMINHFSDKKTALETEAVFKEALNDQK